MVLGLVVNEAPYFVHLDLFNRHKFKRYLCSTLGVYVIRGGVSIAAVNGSGMYFISI
jgi:hypothetical protein